ncbi:hypothetical protein SFC79_15845 [Nocardioides sp. S-58]|uniref:Uncharacterized protein n=1 Tax=Nocardioides renjunii TaxID=3095075 RepID=A0ABU5KE62_9ACTN|nr:hypothetical protein [Nocardioides sp. S-58]MDZ5663246.1 hypothetical protein [Nocardioides sp. S-58]
MTASTGRWQPQVLWFPMGGLLGAVAGGVTGLVILVVIQVVLAVQPSSGGIVLGDVVYGVVVVLVVGGLAGAVVGLVVGVEMALLVGAHLPRDVVRRRALRLGFVLPPVTMAAPFLLSGSVDLSAFDGRHVWGLMLLTGATVLGGPLAGWLAARLPAAPPAGADHHAEVS